ncbi:YagK/YfjJ domain-containing protein [Aliarcobacter butzleri]|uniref:Inovirus-type Gp2 protein n=2 Tax=Aliarcobacter butzleri TaxID=28197 RepID=A0AAP4Q0N2_9BACT|nr:inovirus-type Gp2 protein [Aliarcobacter butzleri]MCT7649088.1 inovirus Gp2 family protein [Aliarcobacter butzleri]MDN5053125.1 inovirus-type Gp2 protein [Aliarcobacter butzleri]MDN5076279.1 inovirus-type Gp2 protein [Aliarcobacter butzleri]MDN5117550.1 inovirus-type Gp2 protein [Aliarcobacter butzleri]MDN5133362.1 inovirus-type Gp2 protein [Aliarcobacter butzleri]
MLINNNKKTNRRLESTKKYIDDLSKKYSKLNVVRVDLGYTKEDSKSITFEDASKDLNKMLNNTRSKPTVFGEMVGYITKKELGEDKGVHIHVAIIYNGNIVREDITKAQQIGEYWKNNITKGKGVFHNCSKNEYKNKAVGVIDYKDKEKRKIFDEKVLTYLCKDEQSIDSLKTNIKDRAFTRGIAPKKKSNAGRPRSVNNDE